MLDMVTRISEFKKKDVKKDKKQVSLFDMDVGTDNSEFQNLWKLP
jgi:hypothetical protein